MLATAALLFPWVVGFGLLPGCWAGFMGVAGLFIFYDVFVFFWLYFRLFVGNFFQNDSVFFIAIFIYFIKELIVAEGANLNLCRK
jgi:hypothetical protein